METVQTIRHLHAAYILTWSIHLGYVLVLVRGFLQVKRELAELKKSY